jgi:hypothetical protein
MNNNTPYTEISSTENNKLLKNIRTVFAVIFTVVFVVVSYLYFTGYNFSQIDENAKQYTDKAADTVVDKVAEVVSKVTENYEDFANMPVILFNNITTSVSDAFSSLSLMTFGGEPAKKSGKMMALASTGAKDKDGKVIVIPKFLSSDDNGNLSLFDLDAHTTKNDFSAKSLSSLEGNIKVATGGQLCIGSTCVSENDLEQLLVGSDIICTYKPSQVFNIIAKNNIQRTFKNKFTKTSLPASEQGTISINWGIIVTEITYNNAQIKQTVYDSFTSRISVRYSKNRLTDGNAGIFTDGTYKTATPANDVWEPFSNANPFIQGSDGLLMKNWKLVDNNGLRFHHDANQDVVAQKTGHDPNTQKFLIHVDGWSWEKGINGYHNDIFATKSEAAVLKSQAVLKSEVGVSDGNTSYVNGILTQRGVGSMKIKGW